MYVLRPQLMGGLVGEDIHLLMKIETADSNCMFDPCNKSTSISCCCCVTSLLIYPAAAAAVLTHNAPRPLNPFFWVDCSYFSFGVMALLRPLLLLLCFVLHSSKSIKCFTCIGPVRSQFDKLLLFMSQIIFSSSSSTSATPAWAPWVRERRIALLT